MNNWAIANVSMNLASEPITTTGRDTRYQMSNLIRRLPGRLKDMQRRCIRPKIMIRVKVARIVGLMYMSMIIPK